MVFVFPFSDPNAIVPDNNDKEVKDVKTPRSKDVLHLLTCEVVICTQEVLYDV